MGLSGPRLVLCQPVIKRCGSWQRQHVGTMYFTLNNTDPASWVCQDPDLCRVSLYKEVWVLAETPCKGPCTFDNTDPASCVCYIGSWVTNPLNASCQSIPAVDKLQLLEVSWHEALMRDHFSKRPLPQKTTSTKHHFHRTPLPQNTTPLLDQFLETVLFRFVCQRSSSFKTML